MSEGPIHPYRLSISIKTSLRINCQASAPRTRRMRTRRHVFLVGYVEKSFNIRTVGGRKLVKKGKKNMARS